MSKGDLYRKVDTKRYRKNYDRIFKKDYRCDSCGIEFSMDEAAYMEHGTAPHVTEMACCPDCGTVELTEL